MSTHTVGRELQETDSGVPVSSACCSRPKRDREDDITSTEHDPVKFEEVHVHSVYRAIADHFSSTRYKAWPRVQAFLESLPPHTMIADVGCGNGKYFACGQRHTSIPSSEGNPCSSVTMPTHRYMLGLDYSEELLLHTQRGLVDPNMCQPGRTTCPISRNGNPRGVHLELLPRTDVVRCDARYCPLRSGIFDAAISIAVLHHYATHKRRVEALVELLRLVKPAGGRVVVYVWAFEKKPKEGHVVDESTGDTMVRWAVHDKYCQTQQIHERFYHLFKEGELECLWAEALSAVGGRGRILDAYYDHENWCVIAERE